MRRKCYLCGGRIRNGVCVECGMDYSHDSEEDGENVTDTPAESPHSYSPEPDPTQGSSETQTFGENEQYSGKTEDSNSGGTVNHEEYPFEINIENIYANRQQNIPNASRKLHGRKKVIVFIVTFIVALGITAGAVFVRFKNHSRASDRQREQRITVKVDINNSDMPKIEIPKVSIPNIKIPEIKVEKKTLPYGYTDEDVVKLIEEYSKNIDFGDTAE